MTLAASRWRGVHVLLDDDPRWKRDPVEQARAACAGGAPVVQLRAKLATDREALAWAREVRRISRESGALFVVNDRFDLALLAEADAVHLGQHDLPPARLPVAARERLAVGRSSHDLAQALAACAEGADYVAFGPVYGTRSKVTPHAARGIDAVREVALRVAPRPLVAIGGIDAQRARELAAAGAGGVAVVSAVAAADDPVAATRALVAAFAGGSP